MILFWRILSFEAETSLWVNNFSLCFFKIWFSFLISVILAYNRCLCYFYIYNYFFLPMGGTNLAHLSFNFHVCGSDDDDRQKRRHERVPYGWKKKENPITSPADLSHKHSSFFARKILQIYYCVWADKRGASNGKRWGLPTW